MVGSLVSLLTTDAARFIVKRDEATLTCLFILCSVVVRSKLDDKPGGHATQLILYLFMRLKIEYELLVKDNIHMPYNCQFCGKDYLRKGFYARHELCCSLKNMKETDDEEFSQQELSTIIKQLVVKIHALEKEVQTVKKWTDKEKKKCNVIDWLNESHVPVQSFTSWTSGLSLGQKHLELVFEHGFIEGVSYAIQDLLPLTDLTETRAIPIRAFEQKQGRLYVYQEGGWRVLDNAGLDEFIDKLQLKLIELLKAWHETHKTLIHDDDANDIFFTNNIKVMGGKKSRLVTHSQIKNHLYAYLSYNLSCITEYEFVF